MTAKQLIGALRLPKEMCRVFYGLADTVYDARLANGARLCDATDFVAWLRELAEETRLQNGQSNGSIDKTCHRCGHVHHPGEKECGESIGGGRICHCEQEVSA